MGPRFRRRTREIDAGRAADGRHRHDRSTARADPTPKSTMTGNEYAASAPARSAIWPTVEEITFRLHERTHTPSSARPPFGLGQCGTPQRQALERGNFLLSLAERIKSIAAVRCACVLHLPPSFCVNRDSLPGFVTRVKFDRVATFMPLDLGVFRGTLPQRRHRLSA